MNRRDLIKQGFAIASALPALSTGLLSASNRNAVWTHADVVVVGGGVGGCAAALAAARAGLKVILTEETDWIGGQLTQQAVPPDEHPWIEKFGATASYRAYREGVRDYYREWYPLKGASHHQNFNPGGCAVSYLCHEPGAALSVLHGMLAPFVSAGRLQILLDTHAVAAQVSADRVTSVQVYNKASDDVLSLTGSYFIDATETGDLLPLSGTEYVTGAESIEETDEPHAPSEAQPHNMQAMTWCFAIDYVENEDHTIDKPANYEMWRDFIPEMQPAWPGKLLSLTYSNPITLEPRTLAFDPRRGAQTALFNLWSYRRLIDPNQFDSGAIPHGISLINWPQNDYLLGNIFEVSEDEATAHKKAAMDVSYALLYWLQTEAPREDGKAGWPGLRLRHDVVGTSHGLAKRPYIRESRRIKAEFTVKEQHVGLEARMNITGKSAGEVTAASFDDSVGIGSYRIDLHPSTGGDNYIDISSLPFEIPMGALIPRRMENVLPACKNLGVTHITNGCYRLHPVEWNIGEAAGAIAAFSLKKGHPPRHIRSHASLFDEFATFLDRSGIERKWPAPMYSPR